MAFFTALAVLRSSETRLIFAPRSEATKPPLSTDAARESRGCLQTMPNCEEEKPPLGGLKGGLEGM